MRQAQRKKGPHIRLLLLVLAGSLLFAGSFAVSAEAASKTKTVASGWQTKSSKTYYYVKGKKTTGWKKISGSYYYFSTAGVLQTNQIVGSKKAGYYYVDSKGVRLTDKQIKSAVAFVTQYSTAGSSAAKRLKASFQAMTKHYPYQRIIGDNPTAALIPSYAAYMFKNKQGNCYRFASSLAYIARVLGYESRVAVGAVTSRSEGPLSPHAWCEVKVGSEWLMMDGSMGAHYGWSEFYLVKRADYKWRMRCDKTYRLKIKNHQVKWS